MYEPLTAEEIREAYARVMPRTGDRPLARVARTIGEENGYTLADLRAYCRTKDLARVRQEAMWACRQYTGASLTEIAHFFHRKDHTTVLHALRVVEKRMKKEAA